MEGNTIERVRGCQVQFGEDTYAVISVPICDERMPVPLSETEREIAGRVLQGQGNQEIAQARGSCSATVRNQVHALFRKLGIHSRTQLTMALIPRFAQMELPIAD